MKPKAQLKEDVSSFIYNWTPKTELGKSSNRSINVQSGNSGAASQMQSSLFGEMDVNYGNADAMGDTDCANLGDAIPVAIIDCPGIEMIDNEYTPKLRGSNVVWVEKCFFSDNVIQL